MTGEEFLDLWTHDKELRQWICDTAKSYTKDTKKRIRLVYMAWLAVGLEPPDLVSSYYLHVALFRMNRQYEIYLMDKPKRWGSDDPGKRRVRYMIKKRKFG